MKLTSSVFENNGEIPSKYTCNGENISPPLEIHDVPKSSKSLVLIMDDPDAVKPAGKVWDHWVVFNIPVTTKEIEEGSNPQGVMGKNTRGNLNYGGPCPPDTKHRYFFKLYALDSSLNLKEGSTKNEVEEAMKDHILEQATLMGTYERS
ncbi:MAG TPA: YbhB/YbcL family Raf kinase inhibitor-like protein [Candidatus Nanoarchaeia archaeon]|nr:YbhB/YbcL family Raf kinase inhibitor-like protein [Candidatus Nanoarchaeia archaeon]